MFERNLEQSAIDALQRDTLWLNLLKKDCENQKLFFAIRKNNIDCYHKGGRLFHFEEKSGFKTHIKYASVIDNTDKDYLTENELAKKTLISDFSTNFERIKENCALYSGVEAKGVSAIYHKHSYLSKSNIVVLDIEISFESLRENNQDRIDILLFNKETKTLQFVEAKHFSNSEIWSTGTPEVIDQIKRYEEQIAKNKQLILSKYAKYIKIINKLFQISLPEPTDVENKVILLIFGFDNNQKNGRLKELITTNPEYKAKKVYAKGEVKDIKLENLWKVNEL